MKQFLCILLCWCLLIQCWALALDDGDEPLATAHRRLKVLVFSPSISWSHMQYLGKVADTLVEAGHEVHYIKLLVDPELDNRNETKKSQKVMRLEPKITSRAAMDIHSIPMVQDQFEGNGWPWLTVLKDSPFAMFKDIFAATCKELVFNAELLEQLRRENYDVGIAELLHTCPFAMFERVGIRTKLSVLALPLLSQVTQMFGIPTFSSYVPNMGSPALNSPHLTFFERFSNALNDFDSWSNTYGLSHNIEQRLIRQAFGDKFPTLAAIEKSISLLFVNSNPFLEFARPISSKIVHIGGLVNAKAGKLDERTQSVLDNSAKGAVLVSFGSITDTTKMSVGMRRAFLRAFGCFPEYTFLWKLDGSHRDNDSALFAAAPNVHLFDWVQQTAILRHPRVRGFVSHCGQNSLSEAANAGVPLVAVPLFGDQLYNAVLAKHKGMAVYLDVRQLQTEGAEQLMVDSLEKILHVPSFRANAQLLSKKLRLTPFSPRDRLVRWVQFAAQFPHLEELNLPTDHDLHWLAYYSVDVLLFSAAAILLVAISVFFALRKSLMLASNFIGAQKFKGE